MKTILTILLFAGNLSAGTYTTYFNIYKPAVGDTDYVTKFATSMDTIDSQLFQVYTDTNTLKSTQDSIIVSTGSNKALIDINTATLSYAPTTYVNVTGNQTVGGVKTFTSSATVNAAMKVTGTITGDVTGDLTGNADTVTTNANLTGDVTSVGNAATIVGLSQILNTGGFALSGDSDNEGIFIAANGNVGIGAAPETKLNVIDGTAGAVAPLAGTRLSVESDGNTYLSLLSPTASAQALWFGNPTANNYSGMTYNYVIANGLTLRVGGTDIFGAKSTGEVGIGTTNPQNRLEVSGGMSIGAGYAQTATYETNGLVVEGNVGIGETDPDSKLEVNGTFHGVGAGQFDDLLSGTSFYAEFDMSALTFTDRCETSVTIDDAWENILSVKRDINKPKKLDHSKLNPRLKKIIKTKKLDHYDIEISTYLEIDEETGEEIIKEKEEQIPVFIDVEEDGRNLTLLSSDMAMGLADLKNIITGLKARIIELEK